MAFESFDLNDANSPLELNRFRAMFGPNAVDDAVRNAIRTCWMLLPDDRKSPDELAATFQQIVDRAIANFREDAKRFPLK